MKIRGNSIRTALSPPSTNNLKRKPQNVPLMGERDSEKEQLAEASARCKGYTAPKEGRTQIILKIPGSLYVTNTGPSQNG